MRTLHLALAVSPLFGLVQANHWFPPRSVTVELPAVRGSGNRNLAPHEPTPEDWDVDSEDAERAAGSFRLGTTLENYPDPLVNPLACGRRGMNESYICDPDRVLRRGEADRIEEYLATNRRTSHHQCGNAEVPFMFAVAVVRQLPAGVDGDTFATEVLDRWGLGHPRCHDGILLLYSQVDNETFLKWKRGVEPQINVKIYGALQREFRSRSARMPAAQALEQNVIIVGEHLTGEILPPRQTPHLVVVLTISTLTFLAYFSCAATVISDEVSKQRM